MSNEKGPPQGPWDIPLRSYIKTLELVILIYNLQNDCLESEFPIDYGNKDDRSFLGRISVWAVQNGRSVETLSAVDWEREKLKK